MRNLHENGATNAEMKFLCNSRGWDGKYFGQRVELNAMTSDQLLSWLEKKLIANGVKKVIPDAATLESAFRRAVTIDHINRQIEEITERAREVGEKYKLPKNLTNSVAKYLRQHPEAPWDTAIAATLRKCKIEGGAT